MTATAAPPYTYPMRSDVHAAGPGKCPRCGVSVIPEGTRFASRDIC